MATHQAALRIDAETTRGVQPKRRRPRAVEKRTAWAFVLPLVLVELALVAAPMALGAFYSLYRVDYFELTQFRGLGNYWTVLTSPMVRDALGATVVFSAVLAGFHHRPRHGAGDAARSRLAHERLAAGHRADPLHHLDAGGLAAPALDLLAAIPGFPAWCSARSASATPRSWPNPASAMAALVSNAIWRDSAFAMIMLLAGLKAIPAQLYAAARVDGAGPWMRFTRITLPLMRVPLLIAVVRLLIHFVNVLTFALILTGGGPNNATQTMGLAMYRLGFVDFRIGEANALAILVFVFNIVADRRATSCSSASAREPRHERPRASAAATLALAQAHAALGRIARRRAHRGVRAGPDPVGTVDLAQAGAGHPGLSAGARSRRSRRWSTTRCCSAPASTATSSTAPSCRSRRWCCRSPSAASRPTRWRGSSSAASAR